QPAFSPSFLSLPHRPPISTLFPYTTLFRSKRYLRSFRVVGVKAELRRFNLAEAAFHTHAHLAVGERYTAGFSIQRGKLGGRGGADRKSTRLNSSHVKISYAVFCLKKKNRNA